MADLSETILYGNLTEVQQQLQQTSDLNYLDVYGYTPLIEAAILNDYQKSAALLAAGADPNLRDLTGRSALHWAVNNNNFELTKKLLECKADPNAYHQGGEPILAMPLLRHQPDIKKTLVAHQASLSFAQHYIYAKLIGHRFELMGSVDIPDATGTFVEIDYEGFYLECCLDLIANSLQQFKTNFAARVLHDWFSPLHTISTALTHARELLRFDHYLIKAVDHVKDIEPLLQRDPLIIPIQQSGHGATIVKHKNLLAICDRSNEAPFTDNHLPIFYINKPYNLTSKLWIDIVYRKQKNLSAMYERLSKLLGLHVVNTLPIHKQRVGNCGWANVEAVLPLLYYMLQTNHTDNTLGDQDLVTDSLEIFQRWQHWDKRRALHLVLEAFQKSPRSQQLGLAALLAGVVFQRYNANDKENRGYAIKIIQTLKKHNCHFIWDSYLQYYVQQRKTAAGENLLALLKLSDILE